MVMLPKYKNGTKRIKYWHGDNTENQQQHSIILLSYYSKYINAYTSIL